MFTDLHRNQLQHSSAPPASCGAATAGKAAANFG